MQLVAGAHADSTTTVLNLKITPPAVAAANQQKVSGPWTLRGVVLPKSGK
ncbi:MAG TPA: hypothetical protein VK256_00160 [Candidatus Eisenbacteria bacterium]|nr:hypothetical protein [Candidatus Eisenbacteria bacterium]